MSDLIDVALADDLSRALRDLVQATSALTQATRDKEAMEKPHDAFLKFRNPYQWKRVDAGQVAVVYEQEVPFEGYVGVVTHIGNSVGTKPSEWVPNTFMRIFYDNTVREDKVERVIADVYDPMRVKEVFTTKLTVEGHNNTSSPQVFAFVADGFFLREDLWNRMKELD